MKAIIYARVSTQPQETERQIKELKQYAKANNIQVVKVFEEKISGATELKDREKLQQAFTYLDNNTDVKKVLVWEFSRIGRKVKEVKTIIEEFHKRCVSVYIKNFNIETLDANCKENPLSQFMVSILSAVYEMERETIKQRMESGYKNHIAKGGIVGRKKGSTKPIEATKNYKQIVKQIKKGGRSLREIAKQTDVSVNTVRKVKEHCHTKN
jgi:DNA invertase Pin-like site-specific DNA recombinase